MIHAAPFCEEHQEFPFRKCSCSEGLCRARRRGLDFDPLVANEKMVKKFLQFCVYKQRPFICLVL